MFSIVLTCYPEAHHQNRLFRGISYAPKYLKIQSGERCRILYNNPHTTTVRVVPYRRIAFKYHYSTKAIYLSHSPSGSPPWICGDVAPCPWHVRASSLRQQSRLWLHQWCPTWPTGSSHSSLPCPLPIPSPIYKMSFLPEGISHFNVP